MDAGWVKVKTLYSTNAFAQERSNIENLRKKWTRMLVKLNVNFQFVIENDDYTYELNLYVKNIDEIKTLDFIEKYENGQINENVEETEKAQETQEEIVEETTTVAEEVKNTSLGDIKVFIIIFSLMTVSFLIISIIYYYQITKENNVAENIPEIIYAIVATLVAIFSLIATIKFSKKAIELKRNGE